MGSVARVEEVEQAFAFVPSSHRNAVPPVCPSRHMMEACKRKAAEIFGNPTEVSSHLPFWLPIL